MSQTIHSRIKERRKALKMSQGALGERVGVNYQTVQQWETEPSIDDPKVLSTAPKRSRMAQVAAILGVSETWLRTGKEDDGAETDPVVQQLLSLYYQLPPEGQELLVQQANGLYTALNPNKKGPANPYSGKQPSKKKPKK